MRYIERLILVLMLHATLLLTGCKTQEIQQKTYHTKSNVYKNPVINYSLPDPTVIQANDGYFYLYATEDIRNMPIHRSRNLVDWEFIGTAFTDAIRPTFEPKCGLWAPDINYTPSLESDRPVL